MTAQEGIRRIKKLLGPRAVWRDNNSRTSPEDRAEVQSELATIKQRMAESVAAMKARREAILAADEEYQSLRRAYESAHADQEAVWAQRWAWPWADAWITLAVAGVGLFLTVGWL